MTSPRLRAARQTIRSTPTLAYHRSIVTFLDILGFREIVECRTAAEVAAVLALTSQSVKGDDIKIPDDTGTKVIAFSDSIVRVRELDPDENPDAYLDVVFLELIDLVHAQSRLAMKEILVRGGVCVGNISIKQNQVFGPGLVEAYELASELARYPRIVISPHLLGSLTTRNREYFDKLVRRGDDGIWFVDYLRVFRDELDPEVDDWVEVLKTHRALILGGGPHDRFSSKALKYAWLSHYHNVVVDETNEEYLSERGISKTDLRIKTSEMPIFYDPQHTQVKAVFNPNAVTRVSAKRPASKHRR